MTTLNVAPNSFSDGSEHGTLPTASAYAKESVSSGADIIDISGYSTRPGAAAVDTDEECRRVLPVIQAIRSISDSDECSRVPLSIDTFRWEVAEAAFVTGANAINDVYAFTGPRSGWKTDEDALENMNIMKALARQYCTPVILMHSRADAGKDKDYSAYAYAEKTGTPAIVEGVRVELGEKVERIMRGKGGVRRWLVIADPGIGFSKTAEDNRKLLRYGSRMVDDVKVGRGNYHLLKYFLDCRSFSLDGEQWRNILSGLPTLVGNSRKSVIGSILAKGDRGRTTTLKERIWATATVVTCAIEQGAMAVRVQDVKEMSDVVTMTDSLWS
jgi:dihydroneopterin aldolase/2-amino-4-hydroxy-6-hydroxymethyldihydropteridine diphosphokinase/dihydropteroate synthase